MDDFEEEIDEAAWAARQAQKAAEIARREKAWASLHPQEWAEWIRIKPLFIPFFDFGAGRAYDFDDFLKEVGHRHSADHLIVRRNKLLGFEKGNLRWVREKSLAGPKPYLTYKEARGEFGIRKSALYDLRRQGLVETVEVPGVGIRFTRASLQRLVEEHTIRQKDRESDSPPRLPAPVRPAKPKKKSAAQLGGYGHGL